MELSRRNFLASSLAGAGAITVANSPMALAQVTECLPAVCTIWAGQTINAGTITVSNDSTNLFINIALTGGWVFRNIPESLKVWVGTDWANLPTPPNGTPGPGGPRPTVGQFPWKRNATGTSYQLIIPLDQAGIIMPAGCGTTLHIVAHLDVTGPQGSQTAFGGCTPGNTGGGWWFYMDYVICCLDIDDPPVLGSCETAFAKGQWIWTTDPKSNPEVPALPSLNLIKNRWGWAINLQAAGTYDFDVWAGAGLNNTSNGTLVGTVRVVWDDLNPVDGTPDTVTVSYQMASGVQITEAHVYIGATPPKTTAPGQYGINLYPTSCNQDSMTTGPRPLVDLLAADICKKPPSGAANPCSGVWIIAHAVVCADDETC